MNINLIGAVEPFLSILLGLIVCYGVFYDERDH